MQVEAPRPRFHSVEDEFDEASSKSVRDKLSMFESGNVPIQTPSKQAPLVSKKPRSKAGSRENLLNIGHQVGIIIFLVFQG